MDRMQSTETYVAEPELPAPPSVISWTSWPIRDDWPTGVIAIAVLASCVLVLAWLGGDWLAGAIGLVAIALALWRMWVPVIYEIGPKGIIVTVLRWKRRTPWSSVRRCKVQEQGMLFLPSADESLLAQLQGLYVPSGDHHTELVGMVNQYLGSRRVFRAEPASPTEAR